MDDCLQRPADEFGASPIWHSVDALIDRAPTLSDLRAHRLQLLAARRWRALGQPVPPELVQEERLAAVTTLATGHLAERIRASTDGTMLLLKGPEIASRYPDPALRFFRDLDLLVADPEATQRELLASGFEPIGDPLIYEFDVHHLRPLRFPGIPLVLEIHKRPNVPKWMAPPSSEELFSAAVPSCLEVESILAPSPAHHALILAAHAWGRAPLRRLRDLLDVALMSESVDRAEIARIAKSWGAGGLWQTTISAADALFLDQPTPSAMKIWARNLRTVRDRTVLENHVQRWISSFWALPPGPAARVSALAIAHDLGPAFGETRRHKFQRSVRALRSALRGATEHEGALGAEARKRRLKKRSETGE